MSNDDLVMDLFDIPSDIVSAAKKGREPFHLNVPDNAKHGKKNKLRSFWSEAGTIVSCSRQTIKETNSGRPHVAFQIGIAINADGSGVNVGATLKRTFRICPAALKEEQVEGQKPSGEYTMSRMSTAILTQLLESKGIEALDEEGRLTGETLKWAFPEGDGTDSPLVDDTVIGVEVSQEPEWETVEDQKEGKTPSSYKVEIERIFSAA